MAKFYFLLISMLSCFSINAAHADQSAVIELLKAELRDLPATAKQFLSTPGRCDVMYDQPMIPDFYEKFSTVPVLLSVEDVRPDTIAVRLGLPEDAKKNFPGLDYGTSTFLSNVDERNYRERAAGFRKQVMGELEHHICFVPNTPTTDIILQLDRHAYDKVAIDLKMGGDPNHIEYQYVTFGVPDTAPYSPLGFAAINCDVRGINTLLADARTDPNMPGRGVENDAFETPAASILRRGEPDKNGCLDAMKSLIEASDNRFDPNRLSNGESLLQASLRYKDEEPISALLLDRYPSIPVDQPEPSDGETALHLLVCYPDLLPRVLARPNLNVNVHAADGRTPIMMCPGQKGSEILLGYPGVDINAVDLNGNTPFLYQIEHFIWKSDDYHLLAVLLEKMLSQEIKNPNAQFRTNDEFTIGQTALSMLVQIAVQAQAENDFHGEWAHLLALGADPNIADQRGMAPLNYAIDAVAKISHELGERGDSVETPSFHRLLVQLISHGANPNLKNNVGKSPLDVAQDLASFYRWNTAMAKTLAILKGVTTTPSGETPRPQDPTAEPRSPR